MRVVHIDTGREMRGGQWQAWFLIDSLAASGTACTVLAPAGSPLAAKAAAAGIETGAPSLLSIRKHSRGADIVHAHTGRAHTLAAIVGAGPLVVSRRVAFPVNSGFASKWKYRQADRYIAVSDHVKRMLIRADIPSESIVVVRDGVPVMEPTRPSARVLALDTADPSKGSNLAREAATRAGIELIWSRDLETDLRDAGVLLYITQSEGLGSGALLAMSAGVAVIASRIGGLTEVVDHGETGLLVGNEADSIACGLRALMDDAERRTMMGQRGRQKVMQQFRLEQMVQGTEKVYREVMR